MILAAVLHGPLVGSSENLSVQAGAGAGWTATAHLLGGFRPLAVDLLWLRADTLFRKGRLWELAALFRGITALDPENGLVREFAAWHLAYNVALAEPDPEQRFAWFSQGIRILERGIPASRDAWRLRAYGGLLFMDRREIIPGFDEKVRRAYGAPPLVVAAQWLEGAAEADGAGPRVYTHLLACYASLIREEEPGVGLPWEKRKAAVLERAKTRFPDVDWRFAEERERQ
ncbi:MAG: hypothetical protein ACYTHM_23095 [Planctomycetota bacterium]